jgi:hypothetical protein
VKKRLMTLGILLAILSIGITAYALVSPENLWSTNSDWGAAVDGGYLNNYFVQYNTGIYATQNWANSNTKLAWDIRESGGIYTYHYTWYGDVKALSHIIIELTEDTTITPIGFTPEYANWGPSPENPGMPDSFYGFEIDAVGEDTVIFDFSFTSTQAPVWGSFYAQNGQTGGEDVVAWNTGLANPEEGVFIPRPDGLQIPEPGTLILLGAGLLGLWVIRRRK